MKSRRMHRLEVTLLPAMLLLGGLVTAAALSASRLELGAILALGTGLGTIYLRQRKSLERSENRLQGVFLNSPIPTAIIRLSDGTILDANHAFLEMIGYSREELLGRTSKEIGLWQDSAHRAVCLEELIEKGTVRQREAPYRKSSGEIAQALFSAELVELEGERRVLLMIQDITSRSQAQEELKRVSERLLLATRSAEAGIWDWDVERQALVWDDGMYRLYGVRREDYADPRLAWAAVIHPEDKERVEQYRADALRHGQPYDTEFRVIRPDGEVRYITSYGRVQIGPDGHPSRVTGINLDTTERRRAEDALRTSETFLSALVNNTDDLVLATDRDLRVTMMNEAFRKAIVKNFGFELTVGDDVYRIVVPERREELTQTFMRVLAGERCRAESTFKLPTGKLVYQDEAFNPVLDSAGRVTGISIFIHDVTGRRHTEQTIQAIVKGTSAAVGEPFFRALVTEVAAALGTRYALVGELLPGPAERIRTVAVSGDAAILENFAYDLANTPCAGVIVGATQFHASRLRGTFPDNAMIGDLGLESYLGVPLFGASGRPLGLLSVLDDRPMKDSEFARNLLGIFAGRAGAELERLQVEAEKQRTETTLREREASLRLAQQIGKVGSWERDLVDDRLTWSEEVYRIAGQDRSRFVPTRERWLQLVHPDDLQRLQETAQAAIDGRRAFSIDHRLVLPDGTIRYVYERAEVVRDEARRPLRFIGTIQDITERKHAEEELKLAAGVFEGSGEAIVITDAEQRILKVNPAFTATTGYLPQEVVGHTPYALSPGVRSPERDREIWAEAERVGFWQGELWDRRKSGETYPKWLTISVVRDAAGSTVNFIEIFSDVTERKEREERVRHLAHHDSLTDLPNRVLLNDRIAQSIALAERNATQVAVMFLDLDRFKNINDSLGHTIGDKLLQDVARRLKGCMRASDTVSRLGGDEFVVLIPDVMDPADVGIAAQKILDAVAQPASIDGHELVSTPSIGISVYPADGQDVESLLRNADAAMYHAKESGRNNYQFFTQDMNSRALERLSLERSLRRALERGELRLHYQPQYHVAADRIVGVEALIRWEHPEQGLVPPARFMPFAEESGLILPIGEWVLGEACRQNKAWQDAGSPHVRVAVNISALQFRQPNFVETVQRALARAELEARFLELELTESVIMHDAERVTESLAQLKGMGLELAIDDFGTGYSSLSYLKRFPIDKLKIDKSFVRDINRDRDDAAIVSALIGLTRSLGLKTIAEGVETREQLEFLRAHGCDEVQGYLLSVPLPAAECAKLLKERAEALAPQAA